MAFKLKAKHNAEFPELVSPPDTKNQHMPTNYSRIIINEHEHIIGQGLHRKCYLHPNNQNCCIKIVVAGDHRESIREEKYYALLAKKNISWEMLPKFYGIKTTNLGPGAVFDLVRDHNNEISKTLEYYLDSSIKTDENFNALLNAFRLLKAYLVEQNIVTMTLHAKNILFKRIDDQQGKLIIVDNIGNSDFIPICNYSNYFAKRKITRKWKKFEASLIKKYSSNKSLVNIITTIKD